MTKPLVVFIVGPTAVGKTDLAVELAQMIGAEIISADSMQVYKELNIATAKPSQIIRSKIPHHLIDILSLNESYSAVDFAKRAAITINDILGRGKIPIVVGGTGLYVKALLDGIFEGPGANWDLRQQLIDSAKQNGVVFLYERLKKIDPISARTIMPNDTRRIIRALEIFEITKEPISTLQKNTKGIAEVYNVKIFGLTMDRKKLYDRINARVDSMIQEGLLEEAKKIFSLNTSLSASQALGYKELFKFFKGECSLEVAISQLKQSTRNFAKRQISWFKRDNRIEWIDVEKDSGLNAIIKSIEC